MANDKQQEGFDGRGKLERIVAELERQRKERVDFVTDTRSIKIQADPAGKLLALAADSKAGEWIPSTGYGIKDQALAQFGDKVEPSIPTKFIKELASKRPARAAQLLNGLMQDGPARRFIRTLDGKVRAVLGDTFRVIDHVDMAFASLDAVRASGGEVIEASLSDSHMRLKFTTRSMFETMNVTTKEGGHSWYGAGANPSRFEVIDFNRGGELPGGSGTVHPLVTISNSETGHGGFNVSIGIFVGWCTNLAIIEKSVSQIHLGERMKVGVYSDATLKQESKAIFMKARDAVRAAFNPTSFKKMVDIARRSDTLEIGSPTSAIENVSKLVTLSDEGRDALLNYFVKDYRLTNFGLAQAVARFAQDATDTERQAELEDVAGKVIRMTAAVA